MAETETEAREMWCPFSKVPHETADGNLGGSAINRNFYGVATETHCLGGQCMAWRWADQEKRETEAGKVWVHVGYCGLAGKP